MVEITETVAKMEIMLPNTDRHEAEELANFLENMTTEDKAAFMNFVCGANFYKQFGSADTRRAG